jgi:hypothetical protein
VISIRLELSLGSGELWWGLKGIYDQFGGKRDAPPGEEDCLMWSSRWPRAVLMAMAEHRMILRGENPGQGALMGIEECITGGAAHPC